ncbi:hypothetical protein Hanom_Chr06g00546191 [Helianthus anomalus]
MKLNWWETQFSNHTSIKFFFHTLLVCLSANTTSFNENPLKTQYLGYVILTNTDYRLSQTLFMDMVANIKTIKRQTSNPFLLYPWLLSVYLQKVLKQENFEQGIALEINSFSNETFTRVIASKGQENASEENVLQNQTTDITTFVAEPTTPDAHSDQPTTKVPTSEIPT